MERVTSDGVWTLFDPYDVPELTELYGDEFKRVYEQTESIFAVKSSSFTNTPKQIKAKELWAKMINSYFTRGMPYPFFKDTVNRAHKYPENGIIRSSNLCMEILQPNNEDETSVCILGSLNLARIDTSSPDELSYYSKLLFRMLDNTIDLSNYPTEKSKLTELSRRAIGMGIMGEAEDIANKQIHYGSEKHIEYVHEVMKTIRSAIDEVNIELACHRGSAPIFDSASLLHGADPIRCMYQMAIAPTASISLIAGTTSAHEPVFGYKWNEDGLFGPTTVTAPNINPDNYQYYKSAYDVDQKKMLDICAAHQQYVDQSISHNLYFRPEGLTAGKISDTIIYAWKIGIKTLYYLRSKSQKAQTDDSMSAGVVCSGCQ